MSRQIINLKSSYRSLLKASKAYPVYVGALPEVSAQFPSALAAEFRQSVKDNDPKRVASLLTVADHYKNLLQSVIEHEVCILYTDFSFLFF